MNPAQHGGHIAARVNQVAPAAHRQRIDADVAPAIDEIGAAAGRQIDIAAAAGGDGTAVLEHQVAGAAHADGGAAGGQVATNVQVATGVVHVDGARGADDAQGVDRIAAREQDAATGAGAKLGGVDGGALRDVAAGDQCGAAGGARVQANHPGHTGNGHAVAVAVADGATGMDGQLGDVVVGMRQGDGATGSNCQLRRDHGTALAERATGIEHQAAAGGRAADAGGAGDADGDVVAAEDQAAETVAGVIEGDGAAAVDTAVLGRKAGSAANVNGAAGRLADAGLAGGADVDGRAAGANGDGAANAVAGISEHDGIAMHGCLAVALVGSEADHRVIAALLDVAEHDNAGLAQFGHRRRDGAAADDVAGAAHDERRGVDIERIAHLHIAVGALDDCLARCTELVVAAHRGGAQHAVDTVGDADVARGMGGFQPQVAAHIEPLQLADQAARFEQQIAAGVHAGAADCADLERAAGAEADIAAVAGQNRQDVGAIGQYKIATRAQQLEAGGADRLRLANAATGRQAQRAGHLQAAHAHRANIKTATREAHRIGAAGHREHAVGGVVQHERMTGQLEAAGGELLALGDGAIAAQVDVATAGQTDAAVDAADGGATVDRHAHVARVTGQGVDAVAAIIEHDTAAAQQFKAGSRDRRRLGDGGAARQAQVGRGADAMAGADAADDQAAVVEYAGAGGIARQGADGVAAIGQQVVAAGALQVETGSADGGRLGHAGIGAQHQLGAGVQAHRVDGADHKAGAGGEADVARVTGHGGDAVGMIGQRKVAARAQQFEAGRMQRARLGDGAAARQRQRATGAQAVAVDRADIQAGIVEQAHAAGVASERAHGIAAMFQRVVAAHTR